MTNEELYSTIVKLTKAYMGKSVPFILGWIDPKKLPEESDVHTMTNIKPQSIEIAYEAFKLPLLKSSKKLKDAVPQDDL